MDVFSSRIIHEIGNVKVTAKRVYEDQPDTSWLGEFSNYKEPQNKNQKLVHLDTGVVLDHHGIWRDSMGKIQATPDTSYKYNWRYEYTFHDNGHEKIKYALQDSRRLEDINSSNICFLGLVVEVTLDSVIVGSDSCWGFESDSGENFFINEERNLGLQAIKEAQTWRTRNNKVKVVN